MAYQGDWRSQQRDMDRDYGMDRSSAPYSYAERDYRWGLGNYARPRDMAPGSDYDLHDHRGRDHAHGPGRHDEPRHADAERRQDYGDRRPGAPFRVDDAGPFGGDRVSHIADGDTGLSGPREERSWMSRGHGEHRGRGPKNYTRSDERIREDLNDRLSDDPHLDASDIEVLVQDGEVTLSGAIADRQAKRRAEDIADSVSGVKHVQNNLRARPTEDAATTTPRDTVQGNY